MLDLWSLLTEISAKKGCFREQFLKTPSETALFARILLESAYAQSQTKQKKYGTFYSTQSKCQLLAVQVDTKIFVQKGLF